MRVKRYKPKDTLIIIKRGKRVASHTVLAEDLIGLTRRVHAIIMEDECTEPLFKILQEELKAGENGGEYDI